MCLAGAGGQHHYPASSSAAPRRQTGLLVLTQFNRTKSGRWSQSRTGRVRHGDAAPSDCRRQRVRETRGCPMSANASVPENAWESSSLRALRKVFEQKRTAIEDQLHVPRRCQARASSGARPLMIGHFSQGDPVTRDAKEQPDWRAAFARLRSWRSALFLDPSKSAPRQRSTNARPQRFNRIAPFAPRVTGSLFETCSKK
jgi:hypothetical protein